MHYHLSRRQAKELDNGKSLTICLPYPDKGIPGAHIHHDGRGAAPADALLRWGRASLTLPEGAEIVEATVEQIPVQLPPSGSGGLASILGTIHHSDRPARGIICRVVCVVLIITSRSRPRGNYPGQWPGSVTTPDGDTYPSSP